MTARTLQWVGVVVLGAIVAWGVLAGGGGGDPALSVAERIACPVCDGESVAASQTDVARSMLVQIRSLQADGLSDAEVIDWFAARYGPEIVLDPPLDLGGILLWAVPLIAVAIGVAVVLRLRSGTDDTTAPVPSTTATRTVVGVGVAALILVGAAFAIGSFLEPRAEGTPVSGDLVAPSDMDAISDETLAATIASFEDDPQVPPQQLNGMRLALAERYFEDGDYRSATTVFQDVLEGDPTAAQASEALGRLGWVLFVNGEVEAAEGAFGRALDQYDANGEARYFYALMLLELERGGEAVPLLEALAEDPSVPEELRPEIEAMLESARAAA